MKLWKKKWIFEKINMKFRKKKLKKRKAPVKYFSTIFLQFKDLLASARFDILLI